MQIHELQNTATAADLTGDNYFVMDGVGGSKKVPADFAKLQKINPATDTQAEIWDKISSYSGDVVVGIPSVGTAVEVEMYQLAYTKIENNVYTARFETTSGGLIKVATCVLNDVSASTLGTWTYETQSTVDALPAIMTILQPGDIGNAELLAKDKTTGNVVKVDGNSVAKASDVLSIVGKDEREDVSENITFTASFNQSSYTHSLDRAIPANTLVHISSSDFTDITDGLSVSIRFRNASGSIIGDTITLFPGANADVTLIEDAVTFGFYRLKTDIKKEAEISFTLEYEIGPFVEGLIPPMKESIDTLEQQSLEMFGKDAVVVNEELSFTLNTGSNNYDVTLNERIPAGKPIAIHVDDFSQYITDSHSISFRLRNSSGTILWQQGIFKGTYEIPPLAEDVVSVRGYINKDYIASSGKVEFRLDWEKEPKKEGVLTSSAEKVDKLYGTELVEAIENKSFTTTTDSVNYKITLDKIIPAGKKFTITTGDYSQYVTTGHYFGFIPSFADNSYVDTIYLESNKSYVCQYDQDVVSMRGYLSTSYVTDVGPIPFTIAWMEGEEGLVNEVKLIANEAKKYGSDVVRANHIDESFASVSSTFNDNLFNFGPVNTGKRIEAKRVIVNIMESSQGAACYGDLLVIMSDSQYQKEIAFVDMKFFKVIQVNRIDQGSPNYHNNSLFFGTEKYDEGDKYPILYAAQGKNFIEHSILAYRILVSDDGVYSLQLVQTITTPAQSSTYLLAGNDAYLGKDGFLWLVGLDNPTLQNYVIAKFTMPRLADGEAVTLTENQKLDYYTLPYLPTGQGGCIAENGYLYKCRSNGVIVIDLQNHAQLDAQYFPLGNKFEIESGFIHNGNFYLTAITDGELTEDGKQHTEVWHVKFVKE